MYPTKQKETSWDLSLVALPDRWVIINITATLSEAFHYISGLGPRSKTSIFFDAFSLSYGLDFSSSESCQDNPGESSDTSSSSLSPTSGYSSYDFLDQRQNTYQNSDQEQSKRRSGTYLSIHNTNKPISKVLDEHQKRSRSFPRIPLHTTQDYQTGIKPASHRVGSYSSSSIAQSANTAPKHETERSTGRIKERTNNENVKEFFDLKNLKQGIKVICFYKHEAFT